MSTAVWVWLDLEMTGLDVNSDQILEVSCILTTPSLREFTTQHYTEVVYYDDSVLDNMSEWCIEHHALSGLTQAVKDSKQDLVAVEKGLLSFIHDHTMPTDTLFLAGSSIHADRTFIKRYLLGFESTLHYRMVDVTAIRMFCETLGIKPYEKVSSHRALDDIRDSIDELRYYKSAIENQNAGR